MRIRKLGVQLAIVNDELVEKYMQLKPEHKTAMDTVCYLIESRLLYRSIQSLSDIQEAKRYATNLLYESLGEWVNDQMRNDIKDVLPVCKNCNMLESNYFCPILGAFINPNQVSCTNFN